MTRAEKQRAPIQTPRSYFFRTPKENTKRLIAVLLWLTAIGSVVRAQQQYSGGMTVSQSGTWNMQLEDSAGNGITSNSATTTSTRGIDVNLRSIFGTAPTSAGKLDVKAVDGDVFVRQTSGANLHVNVDSAPTTTVSGTVTINTIPAGTNLIGKVYPYTSCGTTAITQALAALPTVATSVNASTTCLLELYLHNTSSSTAYTVTVTDAQGSPVAFLNAVSMNPLETREYHFPNGVKFTSGVKWSASNAAVTGSFEGLQ